MCGIYAIIYSTAVNKSIHANLATKKRELEKIAVKNSYLLRHRGNDHRGINKTDTAVLCHERLSIIDPEGGSQPLNYHYNHKHQLSLSVNGEIYNYKELREKWSDYEYQSNSDCEVINSGYYYLKKQHHFNYLTDKLIIELLDNLDGQFSFVLHDTEIKSTLVARDPIGITPLYYGLDTENNLYISSEMKALPNCSSVEIFPAGHYLHITNYQLSQPDCKIEDYIHPYYTETSSGKWLKKYYKRRIESKDLHYFGSEMNLYQQFRDILSKAVIKRMMADVPFGILLSGGLDSSLVCSIAVKYFNEHRHLFPNIDAIHTFSIGLEGHYSPDLEKAKLVSEYLGTVHHNFTYTIQEGVQALMDDIYYLETYDVTTIRASIPMLLLSKKIKETTDIKMVLSGEGSDELLGGYLYFLNAPDNKEHQIECMRRVSQLSYFDCLRANKSTMSHSLEARVPFLDKEFISLSIDIDNSLKTQNGIEKYGLRKAFDKDVSGFDYLPEEILWRQKEQFSDGVGYSWIDTLKDLPNTEYMKFVEQEEFQALDWNQLLEEASIHYKYNTPKTQEALLYRKLYDSFFPNREHLVKMWVPKMEWDGVSEDPSGRSQSSHVDKI